MSPIRAQTGVVTVAKPKSGGLEQIEGDVFLSSRARLALERLAISNYEFNLYSTTHTNQIPKYNPEDSASHVIRLQSMAKETDYLNLDFWQYDSIYNKPLVQVDIDFFLKSDWHYKTSNAWFRELSTNIVTRWFNSHAKHIKREHQKICQIVFRKDEIVISLVKNDGGFEHTHMVKLSQPLQILGTLTAYFLTKDLMPVLSAVADFEIDGDIDVVASANALTIKFETTAAEFKIAVPTTNERGLRNKTGFTFYKPSARNNELFDADDEPFDFEAEMAQILSEQ